MTSPKRLPGDRFLDPAGSIEPWRPLRVRVLETLGAEIALDTAAVWLTRPERPAPDELLAQVALASSAVRSWRQRTSTRNGIVEDALVAGRAAGRWRDTGLTGDADADMHAIVHVLPESHPRQRWWIALLGRPHAPFTVQERQAVDIALRRLQTSLNQPPEPGCALALAGHDNRPISTDLAFHQIGTRLAMTAPEMLEAIAHARDQRWLDPGDDTTHEMALDLAGEPITVVFRRTRAVELPEATQWVIELHPPGRFAPPAVGALRDPRIARALAFINDHFAESPSLDAIAGHVHVSRFHFQRVFTRLVGVSPKRCVQLRQIQIATRLLEKTHLPIHEIARLCGFTSHGHFDVTFRRFAGLSPSVFREAGSA